MSRTRVLIVGPEPVVAELTRRLSDVAVAAERDPALALDALSTGRHDVALVASTLSDGSPGVQLVREAVRRDAPASLLLVTSGARDPVALEAAALGAGAAGCVDLRRLSDDELRWTVAWSHRSRVAPEATAARLAELQRLLACRGQEVVDDIRGALAALGPAALSPAAARDGEPSLAELVGAVTRVLAALSSLDLLSPLAAEEAAADRPAPARPASALSQAR